MKKPRGLSPKQKLFVHEYLVDLNATRAARDAGYSKRTADVQGPRLLGNVRVAAAIAKAQEKRAEKTEITKARVLEELAIIAFSDVQNHLTIDPDTGAIKPISFDKMPKGTSRALEMVREDRTIRESSSGDESSIVNERVSFKLHSKLPALELLAKHLGMLPTKVEGELTINAKLSLSDFKKSIKGLKESGE